MKLNKKILFISAIFVIIQPVIFAKANLVKEIAALELELLKLNTKTGEYSQWSEEKIQAKIKKTKKTLEKKQEKLKKETAKDAEKANESLKKAGNNLKEAGKEFGNAVKEFFE